MGADTTLGKDKGFTHLHLHTQYSLLDGAIRMEDLAPSIEERGMASVAVTDHGNMYGAVDFYKRAKKQKVKPIYQIFKGWKSSTQGIKNIDQLPENAKKYIYAIENFIKTKISSISTSPERSDTILLENPFDI